MAEYQFLKNPVAKKWVVLAPRRSQRINIGVKQEQICPFCAGQEADSLELFRINGEKEDSNWHIRVIANKYPFTPHHEVIIHSPDHHKNFDELPLSQVELILQTYRHRYLTLEKHGQVYIFHNRGIAAGESLPHPHTQLAVVPFNVQMEIPPLDLSLYGNTGWFGLRKKSAIGKDLLETEQFFIFCPQTSEWPDEVWVAPKKQGSTYGKITDRQVKDLALVVSRLIRLMDLRHGYEFPFNFYISPGKNWYLRLIPRIKILGGFEIGTNIFVNTHQPAETMNFLKEHFPEPNLEKIKVEQQADYWKSV